MHRLGQGDQPLYTFLAWGTEGTRQSSQHVFETCQTQRWKRLCQEVCLFTKSHWNRGNRQASHEFFIILSGINTWDNRQGTDGLESPQDLLPTRRGQQGRWHSCPGKWCCCRACYTSAIRYWRGREIHAFKITRSCGRWFCNISCLSFPRAANCCQSASNFSVG